MSSQSNPGKNLKTFYAGHPNSHYADDTHMDLSSRDCLCVQDNDIDRLHSLYADALDCGVSVCLTEIPHKHYPMIINVDMVFKTTVLTRCYTVEDILEIIQVYGEVLVEYLSRNEYDFSILENKGPRTENGVVKDGFRIMITNVVTTAPLHMFVRSKVKERLSHIFKRLGAENPISNILDRAVLKDYNYMYGSHDLHDYPYKLTNVMRFIWPTVKVSLVDKLSPKANNVTIIARPIELRTTLQLVNHLSIRNKEVQDGVRDDKMSEIQAYEGMFALKEKRNTRCLEMIGWSVNSISKTTSSLDMVESLVGILNPERSDVFYMWVRLAWCLRNIDHRAYSAFDSFSQNSSKYYEAECKRVWDHLRFTNGIGIGTLRAWAKADNPTKYTTIMSDYVQRQIFESRDGTHLCIARFMHSMFENVFCCSSIKGHIWYHFNGVRWKLCNGAHELRLSINDDIRAEYQNAIASCSEHAYALARAAGLSPFYGLNVADGEGACVVLKRQFNKILLNLGNENFRKKVVIVCEDLFFCKDFCDDCAISLLK